MVTKFGSQILATKFGFVPDCSLKIKIFKKWQVFFQCHDIERKPAIHCVLEEWFDFIKIQSKKSKDLHRFTNVTDVTQLLQKMKTCFRLSTIISKTNLS